MNTKSFQSGLAIATAGVWNQELLLEANVQLLEDDESVFPLVGSYRVAIQREYPLVIQFSLPIDVPDAPRALFFAFSFPEGVIVWEAPVRFSDIPNVQTFSLNLKIPGAFSFSTARLSFRSRAKAFT
jgi:hypothetical protein